MSTKGVISFDLDGVLANFTRGFTKVGNRILGTPVSDDRCQLSWNFEECQHLGLTKFDCGFTNGPIWNAIREDPDFWANLDPFNVSVMPRINAIKNKVFITNRMGVEPMLQSERFLKKWGVSPAEVYVASAKGPIAQKLNVTAHIDDYIVNYNDLKEALPKAYVALLWTPYNMGHHYNNPLISDVVLSVEQFIDKCDRLGLTEY